MAVTTTKLTPGAAQLRGAMKALEGGLVIRTLVGIRVRPGCERAMEIAWRPVARQISGLAGNLLRELLVDAYDPRSFVVVTEWADESALHDYENGPVAARFADVVRPLRATSGAESYRRMYGPEGNGSTICVDVEITVPPDRRAEFEHGHGEVVSRMAGVPGYLREDLLREPGSEAYHIIAEWRSEAEFRRWVENPAHAEEEAGPIAPFLLDFRRRLFHLAVRADQDENPVLARRPTCT